MAFFDKLNDFAKNISDKTSDAIETGKLQNRISTEKKLAGEELKKIGEFYYNLWLSGGEIAPETAEFCTAARAHYDAACQAQAEIDRIRAENEAARAAAAVPAAPSAPADAICTVCGNANNPGTKFCCSCGNKLTADTPPTPKFCRNCGADIAEGMKFCGACGTMTE